MHKCLYKACAEHTVTFAAADLKPNENKEKIIGLEMCTLNSKGVWRNSENGEQTRSVSASFTTLHTIAQLDEHTSQDLV